MRSRLRYRVGADLVAESPGSLAGDGDDVVPDGMTFGGGDWWPDAVVGCCPALSESADGQVVAEPSAADSVLTGKADGVASDPAGIILVRPVIPDQDA
jgi:hypothetical protein